MSNYKGEFHFEPWIEVEKMKQDEVQKEFFVEHEKKLFDLWVSEGHDPAMFPFLGEVNSEDMEWATEQLRKDLQKEPPKTD